jgi:hypothetical protein
MKLLHTDQHHSVQTISSEQNNREEATNNLTIKGKKKTASAAILENLQKERNGLLYKTII